MKPKPILFALCTLLSFGLLLSCHKDQQHSPVISISTSTQALTIDSAIGATDTFHISSNTPWSIAITPDSASKWLQVSPMEGTGDATVHLTVTGKNPNTSQPATLAVTATGHADMVPYKVVVSQTAFLTVDTAYVFLPGTGSTHGFNIMTNGSWKATTSDSAWVHIANPQGTGPGVLRVGADTNRTGVYRTALVTLTSVNNANVPSLLLQVSQYASYFVYSFAPASGIVGSTVTLKGIFPRNPVVYMGTDVRAAVISHDSGTIVFTVPTGATGRPIEVADTTTYQIHSNTEIAFSTNAFLLHNGWNYINNQPSGLGGAPISQYGVNFSWNGALYMGFGNYSNSPGSIYRFDTTTLKWTAAITIPSSVISFQTPIHYIINNKLYVGGLDIHSSNPSMWEYDLTKGNDPTAWRQLTTPPDLFNLAFAYTDGTSGYVMTGHATGHGGGVNALYKFTTTGASDPGTWTYLVDLGVTNSTPSGFTIGNTTYLGGGGLLDATQIRKFWSITPPATTMTPIAPYPEDLNSNQFSCPTWVKGNIGYVFNPTTHNIYSYDPGTNSWSPFPGVNYVTNVGLAGNRLFAWDLNGAMLEYIP